MDRKILQLPVFVKLRLSKLFIVCREGLRHLFKGSNGQSSHLLKLIDEFDPFLEFSDEVPRRSEVQHNHKTALLQ